MTTTKGGQRKAEIDIAEVERLAGLGLNDQQIFYCLGIGHTTFYKYRNLLPEFAEALKRGKSKGIKKVASKLESLVDQENLGAICFYLKCVGKWQENQSLESKINEQIARELDRIGLGGESSVSPSPTQDADSDSQDTEY